MLATKFYNGIINTIMGSIFGKLFQVSTFGESHGKAVGVIIDGCPPNLPLTTTEIQEELDRRRPGQSSLTTPRNETDTIEILSGLYEGKTLGTPIAMLVYNKDAHSADYKEMESAYRPSHADYTYDKKYGIRNPHGGGRASARETLARVAAGAIAKKILKLSYGLEIRAYVDRVHSIHAPEMSHFPTLAEIEQNSIRCPHAETAAKMIPFIEQMAKEGDSVGGTILCRIQNAPICLGAPVFDRLEADLAKAMLSLPATKGFEIGSGFEGSYKKGSEHNDPFTLDRDGNVSTTTNFSGGIQGGISNGEEIYFRVAFKPTATILKTQQTITKDNKPTELLARGRHDPCVLPRAVPIVEAMTALVLIEHVMLNKAQCEGYHFG